MKARLTAIGTSLVYDPDENGVPKVNMADVCVEFNLDKKRYSISIVFPIDVVGVRFDETQAIKSETLTKHLMGRIGKELDRQNVKDADMTDVENVIRLKMPYLLRKAINREIFTQTF